MTLKWLGRVLVVLSTVACGNAVSAQTKSVAAANPDEKELYNYVLTMDKIQKLAALQKDLEALEKSDPQLAKSVDADDSSAKTIDQMTQKMDKIPQVTALLRKNGLTSRECAVSSMTLIQAGMAVGMKRSGMYKEYPPALLKVVSAANLAFVDQHYAEITKVMPALAGKDDTK
jgi:hypothetical protein